MSWKRIALIGVVAVALVAVLFLGPSWIQENQEYAVALSAIATAIAAITGAVAAFAALGAAHESAQAARDGQKALSLATKPEPRIKVMFTGSGQTIQLKMMVDNQSRHPVQKSTLSWDLADGTRGTYDLGRIEPSDRFTRNGNRDFVEHVVDLRDYRATSSNEVVLKYRGELGSVQWRKAVVWRYEFDENASTPVGDLMVVSSRVVDSKVTEAEL